MSESDAAVNDDPRCWYAAAECLDTARRELDRAGDLLAGVAGDGFFAALHRALQAVAEAEREIGADRG